jgi:hypothetical protein
MNQAWTCDKFGPVRRDVEFGGEERNGQQILPMLIDFIE